jgi:hypothetical protein
MDVLADAGENFAERFGCGSGVMAHNHTGDHSKKFERWDGFSSSRRLKKDRSHSFNTWLSVIIQHAPALLSRARISVSCRVV